MGMNGQLHVLAGRTRTALIVLTAEKAGWGQSLSGRLHFQGRILLNPEEGGSALSRNVSILSAYQAK
jgi:hypothetical protein